MKKLQEWFKLRFGWQPFSKHFVHHRVTKTPWYYGDGSALTMLFGILLITGIVLSLDYSASPSSAFSSLVSISHPESWSWFVRALHYWSAGMMVIIAILHLLRQVLIGGYLPPREGTWFIGVGLFILIIINSFTGYTLRWDERAIYAIRVALNMFSSIPLIGEEIVTLVYGGNSFGDQTLSRLYSTHILIVPLLITGLIAYHLYLVVLHGATTLAEREDPPASADEQIQMREVLIHNENTGQDFHPKTTGKSSAYSLIVFFIVALLAYFIGAPQLYPEANLVSDSMPREEWWWHWYSALIAYLPPWLSHPFYVALPLAGLGLLVALPLLDRSSNRGVRRRPLAVILVIVVLALLLGLTSLRLSSKWTAWPQSELAPLPVNFELTAEQRQGHELFTNLGCYNCHALGGHGSQVGPNLTGLHARLSPTELKNYILEPPVGVAMPAYKSKLSQEELQAISEFVLVIQTLPRHYADERKTP